MASTVVRKVGRETAERLRQEIDQAGFELKDAPHAHFAAKGPGVSLTYYKSGKLLVQGRAAQDFVTTYLADPADSDEVPAARERSTRDPRDVVSEPIIGTDESGKGDYFGPLVVAAILVRPEDVAVLRELGVRDSKDVRDPEALRLAESLATGYKDRVSIVAIMPPSYNELHGKFGGNLNRLLAWCHARAIENVLELHECARAISDRFGNERLIRDALMERGRGLRLEQRVRAESHPAVAAASILARARFLRELASLSRKAGTKLPKGAGWPVDAAARELYRDGGLDRLRPFAKMHFKTTEKAKRG